MSRIKVVTLGMVLGLLIVGSHMQVYPVMAATPTISPIFDTPQPTRRIAGGTDGEETIYGEWEINIKIACGLDKKGNLTIRKWLQLQVVPRQENAKTGEPTEAAKYRITTETEIAGKVASVFLGDGSKISLEEARKRIEGKQVPVVLIEDVKILKSIQPLFQKETLLFVLDAEE